MISTTCLTAVSASRRSLCVYVKLSDAVSEMVLTPRAGHACANYPKRWGHALTGTLPNPIQARHLIVVDQPAAAVGGLFVRHAFGVAGVHAYETTPHQLYYVVLKSSGRNVGSPHNLVFTKLASFLFAP